jgi:hypothetical protein
MPASGNGSRRYEVHLAGAVAHDIRRAHRRAARQGRGPAVTRALRRIVRRLEIAPLGVGDPNYDLPNLALHVRTVIVAPLVVHFAVSQDHHLVYIQGVKLLREASS